MKAQRIVQVAVVLLIFSVVDTLQASDKMSSPSKATEPLTLQGLYLGVNPANLFEPIQMLFFASGEVMTQPRAIGPAQIPLWGVVGKYEFVGKRLRIVTNAGQTIEDTFKLSNDGTTLQISRVKLYRRPDYTGLRISGTFGYMSSTFGVYGGLLAHITFTTDGRFQASYAGHHLGVALEDLLAGVVGLHAVRGISNSVLAKAQGWYEISDHCITLRYDNGETESVVFSTVTQSNEAPAHARSL